MSVFGHIGRIFKDSPMRRFFRSKHRTLSSKNEAAAAEEGQGQGHDEREGQGQPVGVENSDLSWFEAVQEQEHDRVKELIQKGCDIDATDESGWSALHISAWNNYCDQCRHLLSCGANVNLSGPGQCSPLTLAAQRGHVEIVKLFIHTQCDLTQTAQLADNHNVTALHVAAQHGHSDVVRVLVEAGAVVNSTMTAHGIDGVTPLHLAVESGHLDVMDILIAAGSDVHSSTQLQETGGEQVDSVEVDAVMESSC